MRGIQRDAWAFHNITNGRVYHYYRCRNVAKAHTCAMKSLRKVEIEDKVVDYVLYYIFESKGYLQSGKGHGRDYNEPIDDDAKIKILKEPIRDIYTRLNNSPEAIQLGVVNKSVSDMVSSLEKDKETMKNNLFRL